MPIFPTRAICGLLLCAFSISLAGCTLAVPVARDSNVTVSGDYLGVTNKYPMEIENGPINFSQINLRPTKLEGIKIGQRTQYNYTFNSNSSEFHWIFVEMANNSSEGFTLMTDIEFLHWIRSGLNLSEGQAFVVPIYTAHLSSPVKYAFYEVSTDLCIGFYSLIGMDRKISGYKEARSGAISGEFCRPSISQRDLKDYTLYILARVIVNPAFLLP